MGFFEYRSDLGDDVIGDLVVVRKQQPVFRDVIADYLHQVLFDEGYAQRLPLVGYEGQGFFDPRRGFGNPYSLAEGPAWPTRWICSAPASHWSWSRGSSAYRAGSLRPLSGPPFLRLHRPHARFASLFR